MTKEPDISGSLCVCAVTYPVWKGRPFGEVALRPGDSGPMAGLSPRR